MSEYIKKDDALDELNKWDWQELYLPIHFKENILDELPTYSFPDREKGTDTFFREATKEERESVDKYIKSISFPEREKETEAIEEAEAIVKAFKYSLEALDERLEDYEHEQELLEQDMKEGVRGVGVMRHCVELSTKKKLISEVLCFMTQAIEDAKKGDI